MYSSQQINVFSISLFLKSYYINELNMYDRAVTREGGVTLYLLLDLDLPVHHRSTGS